jgi:hypothetical protein
MQLAPAMTAAEKASEQGFSPPHGAGSPSSCRWRYP